MDSVKRILFRGLRTAVLAGLAGLLAFYKDNPWYVAAAPLLAMVGKTLREQDAKKWGWLPF